jgi:hypothetical protein
MGSLNLSENGPSQSAVTAACIGAIPEAACTYLTSGWQPVPLLPQTKRPFTDAWSKRTLTEADLPREFAGGKNIGLKCGTPSAGLIDVDIDDEISLRSFTHWLPTTEMQHGRPSSVNCHRWLSLPENP